VTTYDSGAGFATTVELQKTDIETGDAKVVFRGLVEVKRPKK
jgi:hypothetical protein